MDANSMEHPDEGLIHAWLDDALDVAEAERLAAHVRTCAECQARVAEARGLIAGASRIVAALDDAPATARSGWASGPVLEGGAPGAERSAPAVEPIAPRSLWRWLRVTPGRAALAATILVAIGITLTYERAAIETPQRSAVPAPSAVQTDVAGSTSPAGAAEAAKPHDALLDSAVARNVAIAQGQRTVGAAPGPAIPVAPPPSTSSLTPGVGGAEAVARGRAAVAARRESTTAVADRFRDRSAGTEDVGGAAEGLSSTSGKVAAAPAPARAGDLDLVATGGAAVARSCVRLESADPDARWADQPFPLVIAIDSGGEGARSAEVLTATGAPTQLRATWSPSGDSVVVRLRRIGYSGSIVLGAEAGARSGLAVSAVAPTMLEQTVVEPRASAPSQPAQRAEARKAQAAAPQLTPPPGPPVRQLHVTARRITCPAR